MKYYIIGIFCCFRSSTIFTTTNISIIKHLIIVWCRYFPMQYRFLWYSVSTQSISSKFPYYLYLHLKIFAIKLIFFWAIYIRPYVFTIKILQSFCKHSPIKNKYLLKFIQKVRLDGCNTSIKFQVFFNAMHFEFEGNFAFSWKAVARSPFFASY